MKQEKEFELKVGMRLIYNGEIVEVRKIAAIHVLVSFENGGTNLCTNKNTFTQKHLLK